MLLLTDKLSSGYSFTLSRGETDFGAVAVQPLLLFLPEGGSVFSFLRRAKCEGGGGLNTLSREAGVGAVVAEPEQSPLYPDSVSASDSHYSIAGSISLSTVPLSTGSSISTHKAQILNRNVVSLNNAHFVS